MLPPTHELPHRYRLLRPLGRGGHGTVFLARDLERGGMPVAVKVMRGLGESGKTLEALRSEFLTLARLRHPAIARVHHFGTFRAGAYLVREYASGRSLLAWAGGFSEERKLYRRLPWVLGQALGALAYLESRGLIHGDIKPANILVDSAVRGARERVLLIDFGCAALAGRRETPALWGTSVYSPPPEVVDSGLQPDLYALGLSVLHALAGGLPFPIDDPAAASRWKRSSAYVRPSDYAPGLPPLLEDFIAKLVATVPEERFQSAREALGELIGRFGDRVEPGARDPAEPLGICGREALLAHLHQTLLAPEEPRVHVLHAPRGAGKSRVLDALQGRLEAAGIPVFSWPSPHATSPLKEFCAWGGLPIQRARTLRRWSREAAGIPRKTVLLVDEADRSRWSPPLRALAAALAETSGRGNGPRLLAAGRDLERLLSRMRLPPASVREHRLGPLDRRGLRELAVEFFRTESVPESLVELLREGSGGLPERAIALLNNLRDAGVRIDFLGAIELPSGFERRIEAANRRRPRYRTEERRLLETLEAAAVPLSADSIAALSGACDTAEIESRLELLRCRGALAVEGSGAERRYRVLEAGRAPRSSGKSPSCRLRLLEAARKALGKPQPLHVACELEAVAALQEALLEGLHARAARALLRARRLLSRARREEDARRLLRAALESESPPAEAGNRRRVLLDLALARDTLEAGGVKEALSLLSGCGPPPNTRLHALFLAVRASAYERAGKQLQALKALLELKDRLIRAPLSRMRVLAHLARLLYQRGEAREALEAHDEARRLAARWVRTSRHARASAPPPAPNPPLARALIALSSLEASHGSSALARELLAQALHFQGGTAGEDVDLLNELGATLGAEGELEAALRVFRRAEEVSRKARLPASELKAVYNQGVALYRLNRMEEAEDVLLRARTLSEALGRHYQSAAVWLGLAGVLRERGNYIGALRLYRRVLKLGPLARSSERTLALNNLAEIYLALGRADKSGAFRRKAVALARRTRRRFALDLSLRGLAALKVVLGDLQRGAAELERLLADPDSPATVRHRGGVLYWLGVARLLAGNEREAWSLFRRAARAARQGAEWPYEEAAVLELLELLLARGRRKAASRIAERRLEPGRRSSLRHPGRWRVVALRARPDWPAGIESALAEIERDAARGRRYDALRAAGALLRDPALQAESRRRAEAIRDRLVARFTARLNTRRRKRFLETWAGKPERPPTRARARDKREVSEEPSPQARAQTETTVKAWDAALRSWLEGQGLDSGSDFRSALLPLLREIGRLAGAASVHLITSRGTAGFALHVPEESAERFFESELPEVQQAPAERWIRTPSGRTWVHPLEADRESGWKLAVTGASPPRIRSARFGELCAVLSLAVETAALRKHLQEEAARHRRTQRELGRLAERGGVKDLLDTELLPRPQTWVLPEVGGTPGFENAAAGGRIVARSSAFLRILESIPPLARTDVPVLLVGESGTGKDLLARWIHTLSPRREKPFLSEVCALPENLLEAELFGWTQGAFTGAVADAPGLLVRAQGGTVYLDELTALSPALQARLVRVLATKRVRPLGSTDEIELDLRLISSSRVATAEDLQACGLREDLYWRLKGAVIRVPPLRERRDDIGPLARYFLEYHAERHRVPAPHLSAEALRDLERHDWPGNVRELSNVMERAVLMGAAELRPEHFTEVSESAGTGPKASLFEAVPQGGLRAARDAYERSLLVRVLEQAGGNASKAARILGVSRRHLTNLLEKHGIDRARFQNP